MPTFPEIEKSSVEDAKIAGWLLWNFLYSTQKCWKVTKQRAYGRHNFHPPTKKNQVCFISFHSVCLQLSGLKPVCEFPQILAPLAKTVTLVIRYYHCTEYKVRGVSVELCFSFLRNPTENGSSQHLCTDAIKRCYCQCVSRSIVLAPLESLHLVVPTLVRA